MAWEFVDNSRLFSNGSGTTLKNVFKGMGLMVHLLWATFLDRPKLLF